MSQGCSPKWQSLSQGCHKVGKLTLPGCHKLVEIMQGCYKVGELKVQGLIVTRLVTLLQPCHKLGISIWAVSLRFCILEAIKSWRCGRPGNEASVVVKGMSVLVFPVAPIAHSAVNVT